MDKQGFSAVHKMSDLGRRVIQEVRINNRTVDCTTWDCILDYLLISSCKGKSASVTRMASICDTLSVAAGKKKGKEFRYIEEIGISIARADARKIISTIDRVALRLNLKVIVTMACGDHREGRKHIEGEDIIFGNPPTPPPPPPPLPPEPVPPWPPRYGGKQKVYSKDKPILTYTTEQYASIDRRNVSEPSWNGILRLLIERALKSGIDYYLLEELCPLIRIANGYRFTRGYVYIPDVRVSVQEAETQKVWPSIDRLALNMDVCVVVQFRWHDNRKARFRGQYGCIKLGKN